MNDAAFIANPGDWPCWPYLPLKKSGEKSDEYMFGVIHANEPNIVRNTCIQNLPGTIEKFDALETWAYKDVSALLADGWIVD